MPIKTLRNRFPRLGFISAGYTTMSKKNNPIPAKSNTIVFHSHHVDRLNVIAERYGGVPAEAIRRGDGDEGKYVLVSEATSVPVLLPSGDPARVYDQWMEAWGTGGLQRRCDGEDCLLWRKDPKGNDRVGELCEDMVPCICDTQGIPDDDRCRPHLRANFLLADLWHDMPGLGVWQLRSLGVSTNTDIASDLEMLRPLMVEGMRLMLMLHTFKTRHGTSPGFRLELDATPQQAVAEAAKRMELAGGNVVALDDGPAVTVSQPAPDEAPALTSAPAEPVVEAEAAPATPVGSDSRASHPVYVAVAARVDGEHRQAANDDERATQPQIKQAWKLLEKAGVDPVMLEAMFVERYGFDLEDATKGQVQELSDAIKAASKAAS